MKTILPQFFITCAAALAVVGLAEPAQQQPLVAMDVEVEQDRVPGHNNATYGPVPKQEQLLDVEFLEIAPTPIIADRVFFAYLRGYLPEGIKQELGLLEEGLLNATITVSSSVVYPSGNRENSKSVTGPFMTTTFNDYAHLVLRDSEGTQRDYLPSTGRSDILLDFQIPTMFLKSGTWTFSVDARLGDKSNTCLFAFTLTQWLDGRLSG